jgi:tetratricopeptide (TPR) repeat protein
MSLAHRPDPYALTRSGLVFALMRAGLAAEATAAAKNLINAAQAIPNPWARSYAFLTYGIAWCDADPVRARDALRRGLVIAQDSGNRYNESHLANVLGRLEAQHGDALTALEYLALAIRNYHDSGNTTVIRVPLASLAASLDRLGREEPAAIIAGYALNPITRAWLPEFVTAVTRLRDALGDQTYESLAHKGQAMSTAAMAAYAYDQIDQARTELETPVQGS